METLLQDVRYALRSLRKSPLFALVAVLTIGLAIGANTVAFTWMERFVLKPLPAVPASNELVAVFRAGPSGGYGGVSYPELRDWREGVRSLDGITAQAAAEMSLRTTGPAERAWGVFATANYFDVLRVRPALGRAFRPEEETQAAPVAVISHDLWQRVFSGDSGVVGRHAMLNGHDFTIIGVAPAAFGGTNVGVALDLWVPATLVQLLTPERGTLESRDQRLFETGLARLKPGVTIERARQEINAMGLRLAEIHPEDRNTTVDVRWWNEMAPLSWFPPLMGALLGVTGLVLLVACANLANLLLARAAARRREIGIRLAVGADRARLVRQLLTESLALALGGGALGILMALWGRDVLRAFVPAAPIPISFEMPIDARILGFALMATLFTGAVFGLIPALQASRVDLVPALRDGAAASTGRRSGLQSALVAAQLALAVVSLVCAGLFVRGLQRAQSVDTGIGDPDGVLLVGTSLLLGGHTSDSAGLPVLERLLAEVRAVPGVRSASAATMVPMSFGGGRRRSPMGVEGYEFSSGENRGIPLSSVAPDYFETVRTPVLRGRGITAGDRREALPVAVVNETFARRYWAGQDPLGKHIVLAGRPRTVVGVSRDTKYQWLDDPAEPVAYFPIQQEYAPGFTLHVRAEGDPRRLQQALRRAFERADPNLPFNDPRTFAENMTSSTFLQDMGASMLTAFGFLALALAAVGLYGVLAYSVAQRTREMGVRIAIGASRRDVLALVIGKALRLTAVGLGVGVVLAAGAGRLLRSQIFGVSPLDPVTFGAVIALLAAVALLAAWLPAHRAARVDPIVALQAE